MINFNLELLKIMRFIVLTLFCLLMPITCFSQVSSNPHVTLVEKKTGKRLQLFAENTDSIPYMVFLRVTTADYRRTSKRPILKEIPGNSKLLLKTLILLDGKEGTYDPTFIVNEVTTNLRMRKTHDDFDLNVSKAKLTTKVLIFSNTNCDLCNEAIAILEENTFSYENYNLETSTEALNLLQSKLDDSQSIEDLKFPVITIEDKMYTDIKTRDEFIKILKVHFE